MSADLLRRAAEKLREHANAATTGPWSKADVLSVCADLIDEVDAEYIALMHPPVALALADWLDSAVRDQEMIGADPQAFAVARAILRDPETSGGAS